MNVYEKNCFTITAVLALLSTVKDSNDADAVLGKL